MFDAERETVLQVWVSSEITPESLQAALSEFYPRYSVVVGRDWQTVLSSAENVALPSVSALLYNNPSEFPLLVDVLAPTTNVYQDQMRLARFFSLRFGCRALCDGSLHGDSQPHFGPSSGTAGVPTWRMTVRRFSPTAPVGWFE
jgi:hypothetical protein